MGKQIEFELKEIDTKETIKDGAETEIKSYKYTNDLYDVDIKVKGTENADNLGLPTMTLDDSILVEFGVKNQQQKLEDDLQNINQPEDKPMKKRGRPTKK
jgi:hypothetical protein